MNRKITAVLALAVLTATAIPFTGAFAQDDMGMDHKMGAIGFRDTNAPIGIRWWFNNMVGFDAGVGFASRKINYVNQSNQATDETFTSFAVDVGLPISLKSWDRAKFILRPGFTYESDDDISNFFAGTGTKEKRNSYTVTGELELEVFLAKNASISASHGVGFASTKLDVSGAEADTFMGTFGSNVTTLGFHVYLWPYGDK